MAAASLFTSGSRNSRLGSSGAGAYERPSPRARSRPRRQR
jgi:hypothetical protein